MQTYSSNWETLFTQCPIGVIIGMWIYVFGSTKRSEIGLRRNICLLHQSQQILKAKGTTSTLQLQLKSIQFSCDELTEELSKL